MTCRNLRHFVTLRHMIATLNYTQTDGVAVITFNRPETHNALDLATMRAFASTLDDVRAHITDRSVRVVVLTGAGDAAFCAGGDLVEFANLHSEAEARAMITIMGDALLTLERLPIPVIAAINGYALGGGSEVALACDLRIADNDLRLGFMQIRRGLIPGWGGGQRLLRAIGYARALDILLRGHIMRAHEAHDLGLVNEIVARGEALKHALNLAHLITREDPNVIQSIKALLRAGLEQPYEQALQIERDLFPPLWIGEQRVNSMRAFADKNGS